MYIYIYRRKKRCSYLHVLTEIPFSRRTGKHTKDARDWLAGAGASLRLVQPCVNNEGFKPPCARSVEMAQHSQFIVTNSFINGL